MKSTIRSNLYHPEPAFRQNQRRLCIGIFSIQVYSSFCVQIFFLLFVSLFQRSSYPSEAHVQWADGFIIVYDLCLKETFEFAKKTIESLHKMKSPFILPTLLLANKLDLAHRRDVGVDEGHEVALEYGCQFYEVSAADAFMSINIAYQALLRDAKITQQQRSTILRRRRSSLLTVSKKLGSIFGKKETELEKKRPSCDTLPDFALSF